ncbi:MAG: MFS transporter [Alphaproteobacteria bacterium]|nr:MFS transporter [Alphaproteobacteria bacterium]
MTQDITQQQKILSRTYLTYQFASSLFFISAVWLYFYRLYITDAQVGILDGFAFAIGLVAEVPSGVLADKFGRGRIARFGLILSGLGFIVQAFGSSFLPFFVGQSIEMIGVSLVSGADEALFFSLLKFDPKSPHWKKLVMRGSQMALIGTLGATLLGGWLHTINPRIPWFLTGGAFLLSAFLLWRLKYPRPVKAALSVEKGVKAHWGEIKEGFVQFSRPELFRYVPFILTVQALFYAASWGLLRIVLLDRFHFDPVAGSVLVAGCCAVTFVALGLVHIHANRINERHALTFIASSAAIALILSIPDIGLWGGMIIFALYTGERILYPFLSEILNKNAREDIRATTLSVASFIRALPYVVLAPVIGALNTQGNLEYFLIVWPILIIGALLFYLRQKKEQTAGQQSV